MNDRTSLQQLADRWKDASPAERANAQLYLSELCDVIGVERPRPAGSEYQFEYPVNVVTRDGAETTNFIDLYKPRHFALEAKHKGEDGAGELALRRAFGQLRSYVGHLPHERPPYLLVLDVGRTLLVWDRWRGDYGGFAQGRRIELESLWSRPEDVNLLRDIWSDPSRRDPRGKAQAVTREIGVKLAALAAELERQGYAHGRVARFLMQCIFTMFAEDVGLLPGEPFRRVLDEVALADPDQFVPLAEDLWRAMDNGERFLLKKLLRFNGHFFHNAEALPLTREALALLLSAAEADWQYVEPAIFGTLLTRALDPKLRHRLGAEYTPREYVERVIFPAVEEPIREQWTAKQAAVLQLLGRGHTRKAERQLREFHGWLRSLRFLDPACGSGNFLYVTMHAVKRIELEVIRELEALTKTRELRLAEVGPWQFYGIEVDAWPREIAELVLWIGFHQFWREHHDVQPPEPILRDTGTLLLRDAVLAWDVIEEDATRARVDSTPRIPDPVTGQLLPDPKVVIPYQGHSNARPAEWPEADFIFGNPPYLGVRRQRETFGDGYVDALRSAYPQFLDSADYVMYWWWKSAQEVAAGRTIRAGLITTNSITQPLNRSAIEKAAKKGVRVMWAVTDHPWVDEERAAAVRVAMTVISKEPAFATLVRVDENGEVATETRVERLNPDLSANADVASVAQVPLIANVGISSRGFTLVGQGFVLNSEEAETLLNMSSSHAEVIRPYIKGRELTARAKGLKVIDFRLWEEEKAREYPVLYDIVRARVKPHRDTNNDPPVRANWWRFGRSREDLRNALHNLPRYLATPYTSKHHFFTFIDASVAPDEMVVVVASDDAFHLGVLSSAIHETWALRAGTRLGIGNDPRYNNSLCFNSFPFPSPAAALRRRIATLAEQLDEHRRMALVRDELVTLTGMYNVIAKLRSGDDLTPLEREIHRIAACGVLRDLQLQLDQLVAEAYGWPWPMEPEEILERLVAFHDVRVAEEKAGCIRWLRPAFQAPRFGRGVQTQEMDLQDARVETAQEHWPSSAVEQILAIQRVVSRRPCTIAEAAAGFQGARRELVARHLETLDLMGEVQRTASGRYYAEVPDNAGSLAHFP